MIEVFGRYAGFTALLPTMAGAANRCVIPEHPFDIEHLCELLSRDREKTRSNYSVVLVSEGATFTGESEMVYEDQEQDMFGHIVDFYPGGRGIGVEILVLLLNPGMFFDDIVMAVQTLFHRRNARVIGIRNIGVTILALDLLDAAVHSMAEGNRLLRAESAPRPPPKHIDKGCGSQYGDQCKKDDKRIFSQRIIPRQNMT